jgi:hypothetical protein
VGEWEKGRVGEWEKGRRNLRKSAGNKNSVKTPCNFYVEKQIIEPEFFIFPLFLS